MAKNYAFIDSQNVHLAIRDQGWKLDWQRFRKYLSDKHDIEKAFVFIGYVRNNEGLYAALRQAGYTIIFKPTLEIREGNRRVIKGNVDAELVLHTMIEYPSYDQAVIVSGDGDFHCLIKYLLQQKKLRRLIIQDFRQYSCLLRAFSPYITYLNRLREKLCTKKVGGIS